MAASPAVQMPSMAMLMRALGSRQAQSEPAVAVSSPIPEQEAEVPDWASGIPSMAPRAGAMAPGVSQEGVGNTTTSPEQDQQSAYEKAADAARARIAAILSKSQGAGISDRDKALSIALAGARMASSRSPTFFGGLGEGAAAGIQNYMDMDQRARQEAMRRTGVELQGEQQAESAGARAENRVIRREDIASQRQNRLDALKARAEDLAARRDDNRLAREERADAAKQYRDVQVQIAQLNNATRERGQDMTLRGHELRAAARKEWAPEPLQKALATWEQNKDDPELGALAWNRVQKVAGLKTPQDIEMFAQRMAATDLKSEMVPPKDPEAFKADRVARYRQMMSGGAGGPRPAAPAAAAPSGPVTVNSPAEAAALPPGTPYVTPDGRRMVR